MYDQIPKLNQKHVVKIVSVNSHPLTYWGYLQFAIKTNIKDTKAPPHPAGSRCVPLGPAGSPLLCVNQSCQLLWVTGSKLSQTSQTAGAVRFSNKVILNTVIYVVKCPPVNYIDMENGSFSSMICLYMILNVISIAMWVTQRILYLLLTFSEVFFERIGVRWLSMKKHPCTRVERVSNLEFHCWLVVSTHPRSVWKVKNSQKLTPPLHKAPKQCAENPDDVSDRLKRPFSASQSIPKPGENPEKVAISSK